jgi:5-methylcytosine-specific restriction endonuclease McrA
MRQIGKMTVEIIQQVYEDNIKKYGTLTCYLCNEPVVFGQDSVDHKTPLVRGGTNDVGNLDVAHRRCNSQKHAKTEMEYRQCHYRT